MGCRRIASLICFCAVVFLELALAGQDLQPMSDRSQRIEIPGVSVLPPQGESWFLFPEDIPEGSVLRRERTCSLDVRVDGGSTTPTQRGRFRHVP